MKNARHAAKGFSLRLCLLARDIFQGTTIVAMNSNEGKTVNYLGESTTIALLTALLVVILIVTVTWRRRQRRPTATAPTATPLTPMAPTAVGTVNPSPLVPPAGNMATSPAATARAGTVTSSTASATEPTAAPTLPRPTDLAAMPAADSQPLETSAAAPAWLRDHLIPLKLPYGPLSKRTELGNVTIRTLRGSLR
jgi:hypothetical protein